MNNKICTSIEQSEKLLSLGLDPSTADMYYCMWNKPSLFVGSYERANFINGDNKAVPAWSLTVLLELMPDHIQTYKKYNYVRIDITFVHNGIVTGNKRVEDKTYIDAVFEMICWLIEHGHIKVNK